MLKRIGIILICLCMVLSTVGCHRQGDDLPEDVDFVFGEDTVRFQEAKHSIGSVFGVNKKMITTVSNGTQYAFEESVPEAERQTCINVTDSILRRIGADGNLRVCIYSQTTYDTTYIQDGTVYTHVQSWRSADYVSEVLVGLFGAYCNYGMIQGYANYLCQELYGKRFSMPEKNWRYGGSMDALDLNLLCFREEFTDAEDVKAVARIANDFVATYIESNGETAFQRILAASGNVRQVGVFNDALLAYYDAHNIQYTPSNLLYALGGKSYDYAVKCKYATMYIEKSWTDKNKDLCPLTYDGFLHQNYEDTKQFFAINVQQMEQYQALFGLDSYNHNLPIYFTNNYGTSSAYLAAQHVIVLQNTASLMYDYILALTGSALIKETWSYAGFAQYFSYKYDHYGNAMRNYESNMPSTSKALEYIREVRQNLGRDVDAAVDFLQLMDAATFSRSYDDPNDSLASGASFVGYLIALLGEEEVIELLCVTHDFGAYTYENLVAEWQTFINTNYAHYSKYK